MKNIVTEIMIRATPGEVWEILTDFGNYKSWNPFIIQSSGLPVQGSRIRNVMKQEKKNFVFSPLLVEVVPGKKLAWLGHLFIPGIFDGRHYFEITDMGNGQVKLVQGETFKGMLAGMILRSIGEKTWQGFVAMNHALKERAEQPEAR